MQLQYEDHLRKQRLLQLTIERIERAKMKAEICEKSKSTADANIKLTNSEILAQESNHSSFELSLESSQGITVEASEQEKTMCQTGSLEDLQMQVLSLTQALEDSNRENTHLRNIVIRFKEVLLEKFDLTQDEIEALLVNDKTKQSNSKEDLLSVCNEKKCEDVTYS